MSIERSNLKDSAGRLNGPPAPDGEGPIPGRSITNRARFASLVQRQGALLALVVVIVLAGLRYDNFLSTGNIASVLSYNSMFGLIALGMTFVIITGGIDLSVGSVVAFTSVVAAQVSANGPWVGLAVGVLVGAAVGLVNGFVIAKLGIQPFITTLATLLAARGLALSFANNKSVSVSQESGFTAIGQGNLLGIPIPILILFGAFIIGAIVFYYTRFGRHVLAVGGNEEAARLMGLPVDRIVIAVYVISGCLAGLAGVILASQYGAGQPTEGLGWELSAIASVVVGGTLLTGGLGSVGGTLVGVLLLGLIINILNFENGRGETSLSAYWQSVIRGSFLLIVVLIQNRLMRRRN
jgi:ribose transport system permease protein